MVDKKVIALRLTTKLVPDLDRMAREEARTRSNFIEKLIIDEALRRKDEKVTRRQ